jgi:ribulose-phosphate 3-epimerase
MEMAMPDFRCAADSTLLPLAHLEASATALEAAGIDEIYCAVRDGHFEGPHCGGADIVRALRDCSALPIHVHLAVEHPERWIAAYIEAGAQCISVQAETVVHGHRVLSQIRDGGAIPGIAIDPATPLTKLDYLLPLARRVLVRTGFPGASNPSLVVKACDRVRILRENIAYREYQCDVEVEGGINAACAVRYLHFGARRLVLAEAALPPTSGDYAAALAKFNAEMTTARPLV